MGGTGLIFYCKPPNSKDGVHDCDLSNRSNLTPCLLPLDTLNRHPWGGCEALVNGRAMTVVMTGRSVLVSLMYYLHAGMTRLGLSWTPHPTLRQPWTVDSVLGLISRRGTSAEMARCSGRE